MAATVADGLRRPRGSMPSCRTSTSPGHVAGTSRWRINRGSVTTPSSARRVQVMM